MVMIITISVLSAFSNLIHYIFRLIFILFIILISFKFYVGIVIFKIENHRNLLTDSLCNVTELSILAVKNTPTFPSLEAVILQKSNKCLCLVPTFGPFSG